MTVGRVLAGGFLEQGVGTVEKGQGRERATVGRSEEERPVTGRSQHCKHLDLHSPAKRLAENDRFSERIRQHERGGEPREQPMGSLHFWRENLPILR